MIKYMGSKSRISRHILPIILQDAPPNSPFIEPFVGGCNNLCNVPATFKRYGNDINSNLITMFIALQNGWEPPQNVSNEEYNAIKMNPSAFPKELVGFVSVACSFGAKVWGGYARGRNKNGQMRNYAMESYTNLMKNKEKIKDVIFSSVNYYDLEIPKDSIIYCDPPYAGSTKYKNASESFDHNFFWDWVRKMHQENHKIFVSEYSAPDDFVCLFERKQTTSIARDTGYKAATERLFSPKAP